MADILEVHTSILLREIERLKAIYPELADDPEVLASALEGETRFLPVLENVTAAFLEAVAFKDAIAMRMSDLKERADRFDRKAEGLRALAFALMKAGDKTMVRLPIATLSVAKGKPKLVIDEDFNAQGYVRVKYEPMRTDIAAALAVGTEVPGARLEPATTHLTVRTK